MYVWEIYIHITCIIHTCYVHLEYERKQLSIQNRIEYQWQTLDIQTKLQHFFYNPEKSSLNQRSELFSKCPHKRKHLLYNTKQGWKSSSGEYMCFLVVLKPLLDFIDHWIHLNESGSNKTLFPNLLSLPYFIICNSVLSSTVIIFPPMIDRLRVTKQYETDWSTK